MQLLNESKFDRFQTINHNQPQQKSPLRKKNQFFKTKNIKTQDSQEFNPHLQRVKINYYLKENNIVPYSYTIQENSPQKNVCQKQIKMMKLNKSKSIGTKITSLKQFSCIQTVSQKSGNQNQSCSSTQLQRTKIFKRNQLKSGYSSPFYPINNKNSCNTFTLFHTMQLQKNQNKILMKSSQLHALPQNSKTNKIRSFKEIQIKDKSLNLNQRHQYKIKKKNIISQNDKKTNKLSLSRRFNNNKKLKLQTQIISVKINSSKKLFFKNQVQELRIPNKDKSYLINQPFKFRNNTNNVAQSKIIFDYDNFYINSNSPSNYTLNQSASQYHPINLDMIQYFRQQKQKDKQFQIYNQNNTYMDIIKEINSGRRNSSKSPDSSYSPSKKIKTKNFFLNLRPFDIEKQQVKNKKQCHNKEKYSSQLTQIVQQGRRTYYSTGKQCRKLNGSKIGETNNLNRLEKNEQNDQKRHIQQQLKKENHKSQFLSAKDNLNYKDIDTSDKVHKTLSKWTTLKSSYLSGYQCLTPKKQTDKLNNINIDQIGQRKKEQFFKDNNAETCNKVENINMIKYTKRDNKSNLGKEVAETNVSCFTGFNNVRNSNDWNDPTKTKQNNQKNRLFTNIDQLSNNQTGNPTNQVVFFDTDAVQKNNQRPSRKRSGSKGISVSSKEKKSTSTFKNCQNVINPKCNTVQDEHINYNSNYTPSSYISSYNPNNRVNLNSNQTNVYFPSSPHLIHPHNQQNQRFSSSNHQTKNEFVSSKLKSLQQIKNMKKLTLNTKKQKYH